jgi:outer membrane protein assembly factor BamD
MTHNEHRVFVSCAAIIILAATVFSIIGCSNATMKTYGTAEEQYEAARREFKEENYLTAIDGFKKVIFNFSGAAMIDSAQFYLGMAYYNQGDYLLAANEFERLVNNYPASPFVDDSQYMMGVCYYKSTPKKYGLDQQELQDAIRSLTDFVTDYPESEYVDDAKATIKEAEERLAHKRYESGRLYYRLGYYKASTIYFQKVIDDYTGTEWAARALFYLAETDLKEDHYSEAKKRFENFLTIYPNHEYADKAREKVEKLEKIVADSVANK